MTIDQFMHKLTYPRAILLVLSELTAMRDDPLAAEVAASVASDHASICREFAHLHPLNAIPAQSWLRGFEGPGNHLDRRAK